MWKQPTCYGHKEENLQVEVLDPDGAGMVQFSSFLMRNSVPEFGGRGL